MKRLFTTTSTTTTKMKNNPTHLTHFQGRGDKKTTQRLEMNVKLWTAHRGDTRGIKTANRPQPITALPATQQT